MNDTCTTTVSSSALTDEDLLRGYRDTGNSDLFSHLVHRYERPLYGFLRRYLDNAQDAEDVFQLAFVEVHRCRGRLVPR
jgi:RNA polymerase sigma-70 factor, ECF subfamily